MIMVLLDDQRYYLESLIDIYRNMDQDYPIVYKIGRNKVTGMTVRNFRDIFIPTILSYGKYDDKERRILNTLQHPENVKRRLLEYGYEL